MLVEGDWSSGSGYQAAMTLLATKHPPTAIFAANDHMAFGALRAANERGLGVPSDVSIIGFDDIEGSDCTIPPLTTVSQDHGALGRAAMEVLLEAIDDRPARSVKIPGRLVVRASTGARRA
jgi:DNA-binding LacI/PurR family transcriptional regulator